MVRIAKLLWDAWNVDHIRKHNVTPFEVERVLHDRNKKVRKGHSDRILLLGRSNKRLLSIVLAQQEDAAFYVVTARDMDKKERLIYKGN